MTFCKSKSVKENMTEEDLGIVKKTIDGEREIFNSVSQDIWSKPELGMREFHAHAILTSALKKYGFSVEKHYFLTTAFRAEYHTEERDGPTIAILLEYDALPDIGHACGHNLIAEAGLAAAVAVKAVMEERKDIKGKIVVLGTPAEETEGGKIRLIELGAFDFVDAAIMVHPARRNVIIASEAMIKCMVQYNGKEAHAGAFPWEGINALDAAVACYNSIAALRQHIKPGSRLHANITESASAINIVPAKAKLELMLRAKTMGQMGKLKARVEGCINGAAAATGCTVDYNFEEENAYSNLLQNEVMASSFKKYAEKLGMPFKNSSPFSYSTDMGNVSHVVPSIHPIFEIPTEHGCHTRGFAANAGKPDAQGPTLTAAKAMAMTCLALLRDEALLKQAKMQFRKDVDEDMKL